MIDHLALRAHLESKLDQALVLLKDMVAINSFTANRDGVDRLGKLTASSFANLGFNPEFVPSINPAYGHHLVLTRPGATDRTLCLVSHLDTVFPPEEEQRNHFHWLREGDRIYGPGTHDIKGGTMMMWLVLDTLNALAPDLFNSITWKLFWNSSEETLSADFGEVVRSRIGPRPIAALVFEAEGRLGEEGLLVAARKARVTWRVKVSGRGAHAGTRHGQGANATVELGRILQRIAALTDYKRQLTFNPAVVSGGTVLNRVPHEAWLEGEFRAFDSGVIAEAKSALLALAGTGETRSVHDRYPCHVAVDILSESRGWPRNQGTDQLTALWIAEGTRLGIPTGVEERGGLSDGNLIWDALPTVDGLGPWGENDHCSERSADGSKIPEYVHVPSILPKAIVNTSALARLVNSARTGQA